MQNHDGLISAARRKRERRPITVTLEPHTIEELNRIARRANRSRSRICARMLECCVKMIQHTEPFSLDSRDL